MNKYKMQKKAQTLIQMNKMQNRKQEITAGKQKTKKSAMEF